MTAICGGGTSSPQAGLAEVVAVSSGAIALALQKFGAGKLQWIIPLLGLPPLELPVLCATDPPAMPTLTSDEVFSLFFVKLDGDYFTGLTKVRDMVTRMLWYTFCQCDVGSPTTFVNPTLPVDTPTPVGPAPSATIPCATFQRTGCTGQCSGTTSFWLNSPIPRNATSFRIFSTGAIQSSGGSTYRYQMQENGTGSFVNTIATDNFAPGVAHSFTGPIVNPNSTFLNANIQAVSGGGCSCADDLLEIYCNGDAPGGTQTPCCPPDAATQNSLDLILRMVTLIQRQASPFSYVYGPNHTGLTGHGSFAVSALLGCSVDVTTLPPDLGHIVGSPTQLFDVGFVTLGTADGFEHSRRIDHDGTLVIPQLGGVYTAIGYTLAPGVVVDIRELVREP